MPTVEFQKWITREDLRANPDKRYIFGDNIERKGLGGQAKEMRGEPNAIGVVTKYAPTMDEDSFFADDDTIAWQALRLDLEKVIAAFEAGHTIVVPADGLGTGLSQLPKRAPKMNVAIAHFFSVLATKKPKTSEPR